MRVRTVLLVILLTLGADQGAAAERTWQLSHLSGQSLRQFFDFSVARLAELPGFACRFDQQMQFADGGGQHFSGRLALLKPDRFRWEYVQPYAQLYVSDGRVIWHYEPDLMQAEQMNSLDAVDPSVMRLLSGHVKPSSIKLLQSRYDADAGIQYFKVHFAGSPEVWLGFSEHGALVAITRDDLLGNHNRMMLSACSFVAPDANLFSFAPPDGVDVLDMRR